MDLLLTKGDASFHAVQCFHIGIPVDTWQTSRPDQRLVVNTLLQHRRIEGGEQAFLEKRLQILKGLGTNPLQRLLNLKMHGDLTTHLGFQHALLTQILFKLLKNGMIQHGFSPLYEGAQPPPARCQSPEGFMDGESPPPPSFRERSRCDFHGKKCATIRRLWRNLCDIRPT